jgi:hypothetical protein
MPLTPSVATLREFPSRRTARPGRPRRLVKDGSSCRTRAPSIERVLSPPVARLAFASACVGSRRARHRCRCSRARGFRHYDPASGAFSPLEPSRVVFAGWQVARPMAFWAGPSAARRLLQPRQPASTPLASPDLRSLGTRACARRPRCRETVWPPPRPTEAEPEGIHHPRERMVPSFPPDRSDVSRAHPAASPAPAEVSRARGWHAWLPAASLGHPRAVSCALPPLRAAWRRRYPNPIRSDTSRHETAAVPAGDSDAARRRWRKPPKPPWTCVMDLTPRIQPAGERRLSRSHHASPTPAKGRDSRARNAHCLDGRAR